MPIRFFQRRYPSANAVLLTGPRPVLVDPGFGSDVPALLAWLDAQHVAPESLSLVINTHFDCDHAGANHALAAAHGVPIAAHAIEAAMVNARAPESCRGRWLHQPIEPYSVDRVLQDGDSVDTGTTRWRVVHTPGHTLGHISLYDPHSGVLIAGDAVHADDLGWLDPRRPDGLDAARATIDRLAGLMPLVAYSGHGPPTLDPAAAFAAARRRLQGWRDDPVRMAWHGAKRVFAYALMIEGGLTEPALVPYLLRCPWFEDYAAYPFGLAPAAFAEALRAEMLRSGAARWQAGRLVADAPHVPPGAGWAVAPTEVALWPR